MGGWVGAIGGRVCACGRWDRAPPNAHVADITLRTREWKEGGMERREKVCRGVGRE